MQRRLLLSVMLLLTIAWIGGSSVRAADGPRAGTISIQNNLRENQPHLQVLLERRLPNGKVDTSRVTIPKGMNKTLTLAFGEYSVEFSRMKTDGGPLYRIFARDTFDLSQSNPSKSYTLGEADLGRTGQKKKGK